jgi:hypothetical protein
MFCNRTLVYASAAASKSRKYMSWHQSFLDMLSRYFTPECIKNGKGSGDWLNKKYLHIEQYDGFAYLEKTFPKGSKPLDKILEDSFFT